MKRITKKELRDHYDLTYGEDSLRIVRAEPKDPRSGFPRGLVLCLDTSKIGFQRICAEVFFIPQVTNLYSVGWGQNLFLEVPYGIPFPAITAEIDKLVPTKIRAKVKYPTAVDCCADLQYWRFPNTLTCETTEEFLDDLREKILPVFAPGDELEPYEEFDQSQLATLDGEPVAIVYSNPYDVTVAELGGSTEKVYQFGVNPKTHAIILKEISR